VGEDWRDRAACREEDPELFFPLGVGPKAHLQTLRAKAVCARCPVREECLASATETGMNVGVWGGTSEEERTGVAPRRHEYGQAKNSRNDAKKLAMDRGADFLVALATGRDPVAAGWALCGARPSVVRHALRLLVPVPGQVPATGLERVVADDRLRELRDAGHSEWEISRSMHTQVLTVGEALRILEQRDAAADRITRGVAA
jgi:WhiB family redox-sensing transcriptional regulator